MNFSDEAKNITQSGTLLLQQVKNKADIGIGGESHKQWKIYFENMLEQVFTDYSQEELKAYVGHKAYYELKNLYSL